MMSWNELGTAVRRANHTQSGCRPTRPGKVGGRDLRLPACGLYWIHGDHIWIEQESAGDLAELIGLPRTRASRWRSGSEWRSLLLWRPQPVRRASQSR